MFIKVITWIARILFGATFIFAGFTKLIDPLGSTYKFEDYFLAFDVDWMLGLAFPMAFIMNIVEFAVGVTILFGIKMRQSAWLALLFMAFFTPLTFYIALTDPVPDCGCFGDALIVSNWHTFYKNLVILAAAIVIFWYRNYFPPLWSKRKDWYLVAVVFLIGAGLSIYCLRNLPIMDFRPWKVGNNVNELVTPTEEVAKHYVVFQNKETGEKQEYPADDYPWDDPEWAEQWEFVETRSQVVQPYKEAQISNFSIIDKEGHDHTEAYMANPQPQFLLIVHDITAANSNAFVKRVAPLAKKASEDNVSFIMLTGSLFDQVKQVKEDYKITYPVFQTDAIELKTIVRSNPGLLLIQDGVVLDKWHHRNIPQYESIKKEHLETAN